jgi:hypothetical protein
VVVILASLLVSFFNHGDRRNQGFARV